jgi:hypothetical protein
MAGRPSKYDPKFIEEMHTFMADGYSFEAFAGHIGVCHDTLNEWAKVHPEFSVAKNVAISASRKWWDQVGRAGMTGKIKGFNATVWVFSMKNRFGWRDMVDMKSQEKKTITMKYPRKKDESDE